MGRHWRGWFRWCWWWNGVCGDSGVTYDFCGSPMVIMPLEKIRLGWLEGEQGGVVAWVKCYGRSWWGILQCGLRDLKQHRFEHSWGSQQRCTKCRLRSVHRGGPYVAPRRCLASTDIFQCFSAGIRAGNQYILRKGNVHIICQLGWMDRDMKGSLES